MLFANGLARCALVLALALPATAFALGHERIPLDHWCYPALERFETLGFCTLPDDRPFTRDEIIRLAEHIREEVSAATLSGRDHYELDRLEHEFLGEEARNDPGSRYDRVWFGRDRAIALEGDLAFTPYLEQRNFSDEVEAFVGFTPELRIHLGDQFTWDTRYQLLYGPEHGSRADDLKPSRRERSFNGLTSLFERSYVIGAWDQFEVFFGRDHIDWGPSVGGNLITPGDNYSIDQLNARLRWRAVRFNAFFGQLFPDPERYMAGHRLDVTVGRTVFGLSETVVYGGRGADWLYMLPVAWYYANQFNERTNTDNVIWSVDAKTSVLRRVTLYGSLLIDDFQFERDGNYPDKLAADAGVRWVPATPWGLEIRAQYRWADIYTYSHEESLSVYVSGAGEIENGDVLLGAPPGPDADAWFVNADVYPRANWRVSVGAFGGRIGEGNDVRRFDVHTDDTSPPFPSGVVETDIGLRAGTRWELGGNRWIAAEYAHVSADNRGHVSGADDSSDGFRLEIRWDIP
jgi:hypothetical protein